MQASSLSSNQVSPQSHSTPQPTSQLTAGKQPSSQAKKGFVAKIAQIALAILKSYLLKATALVSLIGSSIVVSLTSTNPIVIGLGMLVGAIALTVLVSLTLSKKPHLFSTKEKLEAAQDKKEEIKSYLKSEGANNFPFLDEEENSLSLFGITPQLSEAQRLQIRKNQKRGNVREDATESAKFKLEGFLREIENIPDQLAHMQRFIEERADWIDRYVLTRETFEDLNEQLVMFNNSLFSETLNISPETNPACKQAFFSRLVLCTKQDENTRFSESNLPSRYLSELVAEEIKVIRNGIEVIQDYFKNLNLDSISDDVLSEIDSITFNDIFGDNEKIFNRSK